MVELGQIGQTWSNLVKCVKNKYYLVRVVTIALPVRTENRGKQRAEAEESSRFELLVLIKEKKEEMRIRVEHLREELRWRDEN